MATNAAGAPIHLNVACDLCGTTPIVGLRYKSTVKSDFDVCGRCAKSPAAAAGEPYIPIGFAGDGGSGSGGGGGGGGGTGGGAVSAAGSAAAGSGQRDGELRRQQLPANGEEEEEEEEDDEDGLIEGEEEDGAAVVAAGAKAGSGGDGSGSGGGGGRGRGRGRGGRGAGGAGGGEKQLRHSALIEWVWNYFSQAPAQPRGPAVSSGAAAAAAAAAAAPTPAAGSSSSGGGRPPSAFDLLRRDPVTVTNRAPLYLQHEGHSRTVVGVERYKPPGGEAQYKLLILDPGQQAETLRDALM